MSFTRVHRALLIRGGAVNSQRLIFILYAVLLSGLGVGGGMLFLEARAQHRQLKYTEALTRQRLAQAENRLREQERILERLRTDRDFVEKVIRTRLSYARPGETIFRFED
jgi:cell division protein DivIC